MANLPQASVYVDQAAGPAPALVERGRQAWSQQDWLKGVFEDNPALVSLAEKPNDGGSFAFDFIITVKTPDGYRHRLVEWRDFHYNHISHYVETLVADYPNLTSYWLEGAPDMSKPLLVIVSRGDFGLALPEDNAIAAQKKQKVLIENREWMQRAFDTFPGITRIVKSANTLRSPTTFALCFEQGRPVHTWMKAPSFERICLRMKTSLDAKRSSAPREIWVQGMVPVERVGIEFTREDFYKLVEAKKEATDEQKQEVAVEEPKPVEGCTSCGASFYANLQFGRGEEKLCGECELKHDEENGGRVVKFEFVFKRRRPPVRRRDPRFDPRPGIDDVGLGGAGPNWED